MKPILLLCACLQASAVLPAPAVAFNLVQADEETFSIPDGIYGQELPAYVLNGSQELVSLEYSYNDSGVWSDACEGTAGTWLYKAVLKEEIENGEEQEITGQFIIHPKNLDHLELESVWSPEDLKIYDGDALLEEDKDYTCSMLSDSNAIQVEFINNYSGSTSVEISSPGFLEDENGIRLQLENSVFATGWQEYEEAWYFFDEDGYRQTGWIRDPQTKSWYWCDPDTGKRVTSSWIMDENSSWYVNEEGIYIPDGWKQDETGWKYVLGDSTCYTDGFYQICSNVYSFGSDGYMKTGWVKDPETKNWYYFDLNTGMRRTSAWITDDGGKWYVNEEGIYIPDGWKKDDSGWRYVLGDNTCYNDGFHKINKLWYYFGSDGYMKTGWIKDSDNKEYYLDPSGGWMHKSEWIGGKYYVDNTGAYQITRWKQSSNGKWWLRWPDGSYPVSSFQKVNGKTYYFDGNGYMVTGWKSINSSDYYFDASGQMLTNQYIDNRYLQDNGKAMSVTDSTLRKYCDQVYAVQGKNLYNCFWWVVNVMSYQTLPIPMVPTNGMTYEQNYASYGFQNHKGNCYVYAAMFACLARNLGYDARWVSGSVYVPEKNVWTNHGWVEIYENGVCYVYDPDAAWERPAWNFYRVPKGQTVLQYSS